MIDIWIPTQKHTQQLDKALDAYNRYDTGVEANLRLLIDANINVSEARQQAMSLSDNRYILFLDDDSEMMHDNWLSNMFVTMQKTGATAVFGRELWGTETDSNTLCGESLIDTEIDYGPAACMLVDTQKLSNISWDNNIGLRSGWLGGDFEEVDYCFQIIKNGGKLVRCNSCTFHHTGGRTTLKAFRYTDRQSTVSVMYNLLLYKYAKAADDKDFFKGLQYVKASPLDDCMLAPGSTLRDAYHQVIRNNGMMKVPMYKRLGLA